MNVFAAIMLSLLLASTLLTLYLVQYKPKHEGNTMKFTVVQYNLFGRPYVVSKDGQDERLERVPKAINDMLHGNIDVVTFAEADIAAERIDMESIFAKEGFKYWTSVLSDPDPFTSLLNGGVLIVSKWPIVRQAQHIYNHACSYSDCLAAKGVKYARINKTTNAGSKIFNVFATHMQAWSTPLGRQDRILQAKQMRKFVRAMNIDDSEPVIYAGDFNTDNVSYPEEVQSLVQLLDAAMPRRVGAQNYTSDPHSNVLVGRDGAASSNNCADQYISSWGTPKNHTYTPTGLTRVPCQRGLTRHSSVFVQSTDLCFCPCCPSEWLDYVLWLQDTHQQPVVEPILQSMPLQVPRFTVPWSGPKSDESMQLIDLSDHYPVVGTFEFKVSGPTIQIDGCTSDADCHFYAFRCYCDGPHCKYHGKVINGRSLPSTHPVNKNCLFSPTGVDCLCGPL